MTDEQQTSELMDISDYTYDVAFSFLAQDEAFATELNDLLQDRLRTFLYSKKQDEIAGTDGEKSFNSVFGKEARMVVVLYRSNWGQTPWTRIEETAIRNRAYEEGHEFVIFIPLDEPPSAPKWLPRTRLWIGLKRWGVPAAAAVIEARVEELGGEPRKEESVAEQAARLERSLKFDERKTRFLNSYKGVNAAQGEFEDLREELEGLIASLKQLTSIVLQLKTKNRQIVLLGEVYAAGMSRGLSIDWRSFDGNG
jgi:hypothetical protein